MGVSGRQEIDVAVGELEFDPDALQRKYEHERDKRKVDTGQGQYVETIQGNFASYSRDPWTDPTFERAPLNDHTKVVIAGGGFGGLLAGARLHEAGFRDIRIIDDGGDFGGTWYWNRYPGAMCDIEAHIYLPLLEEMNHTPKHRYAYASESLELSRKIGQRYGLYEKACFQTVITGARWIDSDRQWLIETNRGDRMTADYLIMACGRQSLPKLPGIAGIGTFKGHAFHSSRWDYAYTGGSETDFRLTKLQDKRVAVVGTGATAIQIVPEVAKWAKQLYVFQRTPSAVYVRGQKVTGPDYADMTTPGWQKARRENFQHLLNATRQDRDLVDDGWTDLSRGMKPLLSTKEMTERLGRAPTADEKGRVAELADYRVMNRIRTRVEEIVNDPATAEALKPYYRWLCKRPCFHDDYLEAFNAPNVELVDTQGRGVERFTERGIVAGDREYEVDCVVFATGFEAGISYTRLTGFDPAGRDGVPLSRHWQNGVRTLHGITTDRFPNLLFLGGNQHSAGASNAVHLLDEQAGHAAYILKEARRQGHRTVEPSGEAVDGYTDMIRNSPNNKTQMRFYASCTPGYYNGEGKGSKPEDLFFGNRYAGKVLTFYQMLADWRRHGTLPGMTVS
jgi:cyclohexanone monooxygenase